MTPDPSKERLGRMTVQEILDKAVAGERIDRGEIDVLIEGRTLRWEELAEKG